MVDMQKKIIILCGFDASKQNLKEITVFQLFCTKNAEKTYLDQRLECAAPKQWSKYTIPVYTTYQLLGLYQQDKLTPESVKYPAKPLVAFSGPKGAFINDDTQIWTVFNPPPPSVTPL